MYIEKHKRQSLNCFEYFVATIEKIWARLKSNIRSHWIDNADLSHDSITNET